MEQRKLLLPQDCSADSFGAPDGDRPHPFPVQTIHQRH
jgi:hypothetical protein